MDTIKIAAGARLMLEGLEVDLTDDNFRTTPERVAKVFAEIFAPPETEWPVFNEKFTDLVIMRGHEFVTFCPHHLLPVEITASIAYLPNGAVLGASKLVRLIQDVNRHPMTQEILTDRIIERLNELTKNSARGSAVLLEGRHGCFRLRGAKSKATMQTVKFSGEFDQPEMRARFMSMVR